MKDRMRLNKKKNIDKIIREMVLEYGFILYDPDGTESNLMKYIRKIVKEMI